MRADVRTSCDQAYGYCSALHTSRSSRPISHASLATTTRYLNIQRRELNRAMEKLEESQLLAKERRQKNAEARKNGKTEPVAQPLHTRPNKALKPLHQSQTNVPPVSNFLPSS